MIELLDLVQLDVLAQHRSISDDEEAAYQILMALAGDYAFKHRIPVFDELVTSTFHTVL